MVVSLILDFRMGYIVKYIVAYRCRRFPHVYSVAYLGNL